MSTEIEQKPVGGKDDPLYEQAVMIVRANKRPSVSLVQRHLAIGYNRASYMLEAMVGTVLDGPGPNAKLLPTNAATTMQEWRDGNQEPQHGCGHMQGRGAA